MIQPFEIHGFNLDQPAQPQFNFSFQFEQQNDPSQQFFGTPQTPEEKNNDEQ